MANPRDQDYDSELDDGIYYGKRGHLDYHRSPEADIIRARANPSPSTLTQFSVSDPGIDTGTPLAMSSSMETPVSMSAGSALVPVLVRKPAQRKRYGKARKRLTYLDFLEPEPRKRYAKSNKRKKTARKRKVERRSRRVSGSYARASCSCGHSPARKSYKSSRRVKSFRRR